MDTTFLYHLHWNFHDSQIWSSQNVNPRYNQRDLLCLKSLEFYLKPLKATVCSYSFWKFFPIKQTNLKVCGHIACRRIFSIRELFARREPVDHVERRLWLVIGPHVTCVPDQDLGEVSDLLGVTRQPTGVTCQPPLDPFCVKVLHVHST